MELIHTKQAPASSRLEVTMPEQQEYLVQLFLDASSHISGGDWEVEIINREQFRELYCDDAEQVSEEAFEASGMFNESRADEYAMNFLLYQWLQDHNDSRYEGFSFILKPCDGHFDMTAVGFDDIIGFVSPETRKTMGKQKDQGGASKAKQTKEERAAAKRVKAEQKALAKRLKKAFGEIFTPPRLVNEMLDKLPAEVWLDPTKTWLDPACGTGNFLLAVRGRLMESLKPQIPDDEEREEHILEGLLHGVDIQERNCILCRMRLDPENRYELHIACADALTFDYTSWGVENGE
jgi:hypothetical protein